MERGKETRPSPSVLDALARALHLDDQEHHHLRELAAAPPATRPSRRPHPAAPCAPTSSCCWTRYARTRPTSSAAAWTS
jgi:hypothetical protein